MPAPSPSDAADKLLADMARKYGTGAPPPPSPPATPAPAPQAPAPSKSPTVTESISNRNQELKKVANYKCGGLLKKMANGGTVGDYPQERQRPAQEPKKGFLDHVKGIADLITGPAKPGPETKPPTADTLHDTRSNILKRKMAVDEVASYACGGKIKKMAAGGTVRRPGDMLKFSGPGGPRADKIPVKVAGKEIKVSNGESAVILPAKTTKNRDALMAIGGIIQASNDGIAPKMGLKKGGKYAVGSLPEDEKIPPPVAAGISPTGGTQMRAGTVGAGSAAVYPVAQGALLKGDVPAPTTNIVRNGNSFSAGPGIQTSAGPEFRPGGAPTIPGFVASPNAGGTIDPRGVLDLGQRGAFGAPIASPAPGATPPAVAAPAVVVAAAPTAPTTPSQVAAPVAAPAGVVDKTPRTDPGYIRQGNTFTQTGAGPAAAATGAPGDMLRSGEVDAYGNKTAITKQLKAELAAATADNDAAYAKQSAGLQKGIADSQDYYARQRADADRFTRVSNEADTASLARDLARGGKPDPGKAAALSAMQNRDANVRNQETLLAGQDNQAAIARGQQATLSKGQQLQHDTAMAQILGSPAHQQGQALDAAIKAGTVNQAQAMQGLQQQLVAANKAGDTKTQNALAQLLRQLAGKDEQLGHMLQIGGGEVWDEQAGMMRKQPMSVAHTGDRAPSIVSAPAAAKPATKFEVGKTYTDAKGNKATYQADGTWK